MNTSYPIMFSRQFIQALEGGHCYDTELFLRNNYRLRSVFANWVENQPDWVKSHRRVVADLFSKTKLFSAKTRIYSAVCVILDSDVRQAEECIFREDKKGILQFFWNHQFQKGKLAYLVHKYASNIYEILGAEGWSSLFENCLCISSLLIHHCPKFDEWIEKGRSPLAFVINNHNFKEVNNLLSQLSKEQLDLLWNKKDEESLDTLLHVAVQTRNLRIVARLRKRDPKAFKEGLVSRNLKGETPVHTAAKIDSNQILLYLFRFTTEEMREQIYDKNLYRKALRTLDLVECHLPKSLKFKAELAEIYAEKGSIRELTYLLEGILHTPKEAPFLIHAVRQPFLFEYLKKYLGKTEVLERLDNPPEEFQDSQNLLVMEEPMTIPYPHLTMDKSSLEQLKEPRSKLYKHPLTRKLFKRARPEKQLKEKIERWLEKTLSS